MVDGSPPSSRNPADPIDVANPVTGERFRFHSPPEDPEIDPLELDLWAPADMVPIAEHVHPRQDETFRIEAGTVELTRDGQSPEFSPGDEVTVPAGTPHSWRPAGEADVHLSVRFSPGLTTGAFLRDLATLGHRGDLKPDGATSLLWVAAMYDAYGFDVMHLASSPLGLQKALVALIAPVAGRLPSTDRRTEFPATGNPSPRLPTADYTSS